MKNGVSTIARILAKQEKFRAKTHTKSEPYCCRHSISCSAWGKKVHSGQEAESSKSAVSHSDIAKGASEVVVSMECHGLSSTSPSDVGSV